MGQCKWCSRTGWFLSLTSEGLCSSCKPIVHMDVVQRIRIINDSMKIINNSKNLDTRLSRLELLIDHANALLRYEQKGIFVADQSPSSILSKYLGMKDQIIIESLKNDADLAIAKSKSAATLSAKINVLQKVLIKIKEYEYKTTKSNALYSLGKLISNQMHRYQLENYLDAANKAEFKSQKNKALDQYYEALYLLKHDDVDDTLQHEQINAIEKKIIELGGSIK